MPPLLPLIVRHMKAGMRLTGMYKTIIVDDDPWALVDIKACFPFEANGFSVVAECTNAEVALPLILHHQPKLVITDIRMGSASGLDLIRKCRDKGVTALFVILSGYDSFEYAKEAISLSAYCYMLKPINDREAQTVMRQAAQYLSLHEPLLETRIGFDDYDAFQSILTYIDLHSNEEINLSDLSGIFFLNRTYICDLFRKKTGRTFKEHLNMIRIRKACRLLSDSSHDIGSIAHCVGFDDTHYFSRVFKAIMKTTAREYRSSRRKNENMESVS